MGGDVTRARQRSAEAWSAGARTGSLDAISRSCRAVALVVVPAGVLLWLVWLCGIGLRDQRYFDGWLLAAGMGVQLCFHVATKVGRLSPVAAARWRTVHIFVGYLVIVAFASHVNLSWPDSLLEWALALGFVLVAASGVAGTCLAWWLKARGTIDPALTLDGIDARRSELARAAEATAMHSQPVAATMLPAPPYESWIADLYATRLRDYFAAPCSIAGHLIGSRSAIKRLSAEIDELSGYLDEPGRAKLADLQRLAVERRRLDSMNVQLRLGEAWLLIHVPVTYTLIVLSVLHILVVYAFTARPW